MTLKRAKQLMGLVKLLSRKTVPIKTSTPPSFHSNHHLITIGYSHYCEKIRFALSLSSISTTFIEERHLPAFHIPFTLDLRKVQRYPQTPQQYHVYDYLKHCGIKQEKEHVKEKEKLSPKELTGVPKMYVNIGINNSNSCSSSESSQGDTSQVPVVIADGSNGIMKYLHHHCHQCQHFYPEDISDQVEELEIYLDTELGASASDWAFSNMLLTSSDPTPRNEKSLDYFLNELTKLDDDKNSFVEILLFKIFGKSTLIPLMVESNGVSASNKETSRKKITDIFEKIDAILVDRENLTSKDNNGGKFTYLFGTMKPTAADITLATLAAPVLLLDATKENFPTLESMKTYISQRDNDRNNALECEGLIDMVNFAAQMRETKTGMHCNHI